MAEVEQWKDRFLHGAENALRSHPRDEHALKNEEINDRSHEIYVLKQKVGELVMDTDILKTALEVKGIPPPFLHKNSGE